MHLFVGSQQSADVVHFSCGPEHVFGVLFEQMRLCIGPFGSQ